MYRRTVQRAICLAIAAAMLLSLAITVPRDAKAAGGATYYVDNVNGNDASNGTSAGTAWKTLTKVNATTFAPGDKILFKAGGAWQGQLWPKGSGVNGSPIVIDQYGTGNKPLIAGVTSELQRSTGKSTTWRLLILLHCLSPGTGKGPGVSGVASIF